MTGHCSKPTLEASHPPQNKSQSLCSDHRTLHDLTPLSLWPHLLSLSHSSFVLWPHKLTYTKHNPVSHTLSMLFLYLKGPMWLPLSHLPAQAWRLFIPAWTALPGLPLSGSSLRSPEEMSPWFGSKADQVPTDSCGPIPAHPAVGIRLFPEKTPGI